MLVGLIALSIFFGYVGQIYEEGQQTTAVLGSIADMPEGAVCVLVAACAHVPAPCERVRRGSAVEKAFCFGRRSAVSAARGAASPTNSTALRRRRRRRRHWLSHKPANAKPVRDELCHMPLHGLRLALIYPNHVCRVEDLHVRCVRKK